MPWSGVISSGDVVAIHAALVSTSNGDGEIVLFGGDNHDFQAHKDGRIDHTARFNCRNPIQALAPVTSPPADVFCCGHAFLYDGRLLTAGGTTSFPEDSPPDHMEHKHFGGDRQSSVYSAATKAFTEVASMGPRPGTTFGGGRWYPSLCTLMTGEVLAVGGHPRGDDERHNNNQPERYQPLVDRWVFLAGTGAEGTDDPDLYPRMHVLRDGTVFVSSELQGNSGCIAINPWNSQARKVCDLPDGAYRVFDSPSVLLPLTPRDNYRPRVLLCGGVTSQVSDLADDSPEWSTVPRNGSTASLARPKACATILPTGDVLMNGGSPGGGAGVMEPELYSTPLDHAIGAPSYVGGPGSWRTIPEPATVVRNYHSTALLMPDGRVWTGGGNKETPPTQPGSPPAEEQKKIEIFDPPYPAGDRPTITQCPRVIAYDREFSVESPEASEIRSVTLLRCGSSTHAFNPDQRCIFLSFTVESANRLRVTAPPDGAVAPPGQYMLFLVDNAGRPCQYATFVRVGGKMSLLPEPADQAVLADSSGATPSLASHGGRLFLAWKGSGNRQLNLMFSDDNGATFRGKRVFGDTTPHGPSLVLHAGRLLLAWAGEGDENLNVARVTLIADTAGGFGIEGLEDKVVLADSSGETPSLASHGGRLFLAWKGSGNRQLNLMFSDDNGATFRGKRVFGDTTPHGPSLVSHAGRLLLAWAGEGDENLNVARVTLIADTAGGFGIEGLEDKVVLADSSGATPSLASHGGRLFLAWKGSGNRQLNLMFSDDNGATFRGKRVFGDTTPHGPSLVSHAGRLPLAWAGEGDENLNVARVTQSLVSEIRWPRQLVNSFGEDVPQNALGEPDGVAYVVRPGSGATFGEFDGRFYPDLFELLGAADPRGDSISRDALLRTDVVAYEDNGNSPAAGGGWESCDWTFTDGVTTIFVSWDGRAAAARDPHIVANGSIRGSDFENYFEATRADEVVSFLAFRLPELRTDDPRFTVTIVGTPSPGGGQEATPDVEGIGVLPRGY